MEADYLHQCLKMLYKELKLISKTLTIPLLQ